MNQYILVGVLVLCGKVRWFVFVVFVNGVVRNMKICLGCEEDWNEACEQIRNGHHFATSVDREFEFPHYEGEDSPHFIIDIVDDDGEGVMW